jgi:hypothetical protein
MSDKVEVINVPNTLRAKVGGRLGAIDTGAIAKAEAALADLSSQFDQWLEDEVNKVLKPMVRPHKTLKSFILRFTILRASARPMATHS